MHLHSSTTLLVYFYRTHKHCEYSSVCARVYIVYLYINKCASECVWVKNCAVKFIDHNSRWFTPNKHQNMWVCVYAVLRTELKNDIAKCARMPCLFLRTPNAWIAFCEERVLVPFARARVCVFVFDFEIASIGHFIHTPCICCHCMNALELYFAKYGHKHSMMLMIHSWNKTTKLESGKKTKKKTVTASANSNALASMHTMVALRLSYHFS